MEEKQLCLKRYARRRLVVSLCLSYFHCVALLFGVLISEALTDSELLLSVSQPHYYFLSLFLCVCACLRSRHLQVYLHRFFVSVCVCARAGFRSRQLQVYLNVFLCVTDSPCLHHTKHLMSVSLFSPLFLSLSYSPSFFLSPRHLFLRHF